MIRFNSQQLIRDFDAVAKRRKISLNKAAVRSNIQPSTAANLRTGKVEEITVITLARMLDFMDETDVGKYIYDDDE
jgi:DNA-binding Xre family transcriptional regulator